MEDENKSGRRKKPFVIPDEKDFPFKDARELFKNHEIIDPETIELKWVKPDEENLKKFLVEQKGFSEARIESAVKKANTALSKGHNRKIEDFFKPV